MKILFLGYDNTQTRIVSFLKSQYEVTNISHKITQELDIQTFDLVISFGYRHIIKNDTINKCQRPPINLHISLLPFNRGAHPNFWAWFDNTKHGVTIHHIDEGIDTGDIVIQQEVKFNRILNLSESYNILKTTIENLFIDNWDKISSYSYKPIKQVEKGTFHSARELPKFEGGWEQSIEQIKLQLSSTKIINN